MVETHISLQMQTTMVPVAPEQLWTVLKVIHYGYPALVFLYFVLALTITVCTLQTKQLRVKDQYVRRDVILGLIFGITITYLIEVFTVVIRVILNDGGDPGQDRIVYLIASTIAFCAQALALTDSKFPVWYPYYGTWFLGLIVELVLAVVPHVFQPPNSPFDYVVIVIQSLRVCIFIILPSLYFGLRNDKKEYDNCDAERQSLLRKKLAPKAASSDNTTANVNSYGGTTDANSQGSETAENSSDAGSEEDSYLAAQRKAQERIDKRLEQEGNWFTYAKGFTVFLPHLWPFHNKALQFRAVLVGFCLLASNALNVLVPNQMGVMIDSLTKYAQGDSETNIWLPVVIYTVLRFISGGACIGWIRRWLWIPLEQYSYDALSTASHAHLMSLSSDFHDNKTSSDLSQAINGGRSVADLLETVCFQVIPMFIDLAIAFAYLWSLFGPYMGLMMAATVLSYLYITTKLYARRASKRRDYITIYRKEYTIGQQSLDGWSTASLFNMIPYERHRYACAVKDHMKAKRTYEMSSQAITAAQGLVMTLGLLGALWLGVYQVAYNGKSVGKFTTLLVYWAQLQSPLIFFSSMYRQISYSLMDAERLLELFQTKPTIADAPNAKPLRLGTGLVKFDQVSFAYDERKPTLKDVSFVVPAGKTVALVGETGGGKSTILKLIDRFYDVNSGSISIDSQDIRDVCLESLREKIGVVPQDPMLFNDSIMNNIRYARITASDKEVYEACKAAAIHEKIMSFPDGYNSKVGDRGVKLSGGEKQRVAIARAILKQPQIILLDEATSAVDTETEQLIQEGFKTLCNGRTTFIVAHRLSTIMKADRILVVMNGAIVEEGSHDELVHKKGKYHDLWSRQIMVTPMTDRSRSRSPKKQDLNLINDLTPNRSKVELAKILYSAPHDETCQSNPPKPNVIQIPDGGAEGMNQDQGKIEQGKKSAEDLQSGPVNQREGSRLKPDAPEFVPTQMNSTPTGHPKLNLKEAAKAQKKKERDERKAASLAKKAGKKVSKHLENPNASPADESTPLIQTDGHMTDAEASTADMPKLKRSRLARRHMAKSEPGNRVIVSHDGQQDSDLTAVSSGEGQPLLMAPDFQHRRVSAPSDPPSTTQESRATRHRRNRHWRMKNRAGEGHGSATASGTGSSAEASSDSHSVPAPPNPTPVTGSSRGSESMNPVTKATY